MTQKLRAIFQIEYKEHLTHIRAALEKATGDGMLSGPALDDAFRRAHSLKGAARAVGLPAVERLSHDLESVFAKVRDGALSFDRAMIPAFHLVLDSLEDTANASMGGQIPAEPVAALDVLAALREGRPAPAPVPAAVASPPHMGDTEPVTVGQPTESSSFAATLRVSTEAVDSILEIADELLIEAMRQDTVASEFGGLTRALSSRNREQASVRHQADPQLRRVSEMPELSSVLGYINYLEQQLHTSCAQNRHLAETQRKGAWTLRRLTADLQASVLRARMVPADSLYENFGKMVRDLARSEGKQILYEARGLSTLADRHVLESLRDPIMHVLRNAVDHAIETPEVRLSRSKSGEGSVRLSLEASRGKLTITVDDDGNGLDWEKISHVAAEQRIPDEAGVERLIFRAGFSTADSVSSLSGRGMGLSVAYEAVARLQGHIDARQNALGGTTFVIAVPLAISSQYLIQLSCAGQIYAIPAHLIEHLHRATPARDFKLVEGKQIFQTAAGPVPVLYLRHCLNFDDNAQANETVSLAVVNISGHGTALVVDRFLSGRQAIVQPIGDAAVFGEKVVGVILAEDGSVIPVLNLAGLLDPVGIQANWCRTVAPDDVPVTKVPGILVVDDSMTTRTLEKNILESQGFRVSVSVDGSQALARLNGQDDFDLVITDVEMPLMNGFELIQEMKKNPRLARIPIIIVSSLEKREDKERGLSLGADAYIVKRSFEQQELLEVIRQII